MPQHIVGWGGIWLLEINQKSSEQGQDFMLLLGNILHKIFTNDCT